MAKRTFERIVLEPILTPNGQHVPRPIQKGEWGKDMGLSRALCAPWLDNTPSLCRYLPYRARTEAYEVDVPDRFTVLFQDNIYLITDHVGNLGRSANHGTTTRSDAHALCNLLNSMNDEIHRLRDEVAKLKGQ